MNRKFRERFIVAFWILVFVFIFINIVLLVVLVNKYSWSPVYK